MNFKMPPIEKIHEAYSAIADDRVILKNEEAEVTSSNKSKTYSVNWKDNVYSSNDNASYWQGYMGYPIIAVLMKQGKLSLDKKIADYFKDINWKQLNTEYKNDFSKVVEILLNSLKENGVDITKINDEVNKVYKEMETLNVKLKRSSLRPPR